jgi:hypothetical protein
VQAWRGFFAAFPDYRNHFEQVLLSDSEVVHRRPLRLLAEPFGRARTMDCEGSGRTDRRVARIRGHERQPRAPGNRILAGIRAN